MNGVISLRPATAADLDWLEPFYERLMRPLVELTHEWNPNAFRGSFDPSTTSIVQLDGEAIGMLKTESAVDCLHLRDIQVKEEFQGRGIGSIILRDVLNKADGEGKPVRLRVLKANRAVAWYERFGFQVTGEQAHAWLMQKPAGDPPKSA